MIRHRNLAVEVEKMEPRFFVTECTHMADMELASESAKSDKGSSTTPSNC